VSNPFEPSETVYIRTTENERIVVRALPAPGPPGPPGDLPVTLEIELTLSRFYPNVHKEILYGATDFDDDADVPLRIDTWDSSSKLNLIFTKVFEYGPDSKILTITSTYLPTGAKIVKTINRDSSGRFISVDRTFTP
jgi:hypothetical protein